MKIIITSLLLFILISADAQNFDFIEIINEVKKFPESVQHSTLSVSKQIQKKFNNPKNQLKAAFFWTSNSIDYATEQVRKNLEYSSKEHLISISMKSKRAVCQGFSEVFNEICHQLGFEAYVVSGYTSQENSIFSNTGHAWNAIKINNEWYLFDPTWAAGHYLIRNSRTNNKSSNYIKTFSAEYYKIPPEEFIKTHMPFDPLWQLSNQVITYKQFDQKRFKNKSSRRIDFNEIINRLPYISETQRFRNKLDRILTMGKGNQVTNKNRKNLRRNLQIALDNKEGKKYNESLEIQLRAIEIFNKYVDTFNQNRSNLSRIKTQLTENLRQSYQAANESLMLYKQISTTNKTLQLNIRIRRAELDELFDKLAKEMKTLDDW